MSCVRKENTRITVTQIENIRELNFLKELHDNYITLLRSSYGPKSSLKLIRNSAGSDFLTSSSRTLLEQLSFSNPCFKFINALISAQNKTYGVNGLFVGLLCSNLLLRALKNEELNYRVVREVSEHIQSTLLKKLQEERMKFSYELHIDRIEEVLCVIRSIITSKSYYIFSLKEIEHLSLKIIEAFLKTIPTEKESFGEVHIVDIEGIPAMKSIIFNGYLFRVHDSSFEEFSKLIKVLPGNDMKFVIFTVPLSPDVPKTNLIEWHSELSVEYTYVEKFLKKLSTLLHKLNVKIIMNQMYIHENLKYDLGKQGFLVLDRLGTLLTDSLIRATGCSPISSLSGIEFILDNHIGVASSVKAVNFNDKAYVHFLPREPVYDVSLILPAVNNHVFKYLKECVNVGVYVLRELIKDPVVVPGAGCFESYMALTILQMRDEDLSRIENLYRTTSSSVNKIFCEYIETFLYLSMLPASGKSKNSLEFYIDNEFFHFWKANNLSESCDNPVVSSAHISDLCSCGSVSKDQVAIDSQFYSVIYIKSHCRSNGVKLKLKKIEPSLNSLLLSTEIKKDSVLNIRKNSILDPFAAKLNSIRFAFDGFSELFRLGSFVFDE